MAVEPRACAVVVAPTTDACSISAVGLTKRFGSAWALRGATLRLPQHGVVGILGPNGAGKTTLIRMFAGVLAPDDGELTVDGIDARVNAQQARAAVGYLPESAPLYPELTVREYLKFRADLAGVPRAQREHLDRTYVGGITQFIEDCIETVFTKLPLQDNYFWRVYLTGEYTPDCCPEYVKQENFEKLKGGLVDRLHVYTASVLDCLKTEQLTISRFVLLDHMDWLSSHRFPILEAEWQAIVEQSAPKTRIIWRSGGLQTDYVNRVNVTVNGKPRQVGEILKYNKAIVDELHPKDRVHTYGSFFVADLDLN